jgi:hypothetical protein
MPLLHMSMMFNLGHTTLVRKGHINTLGDVVGTSIDESLLSFVDMLQPNQKFSKSPWNNIYLSLGLNGSLIVSISDVTNSFNCDHSDGHPFNSPSVQESPFTLLPLCLDDPIVSSLETSLRVSIDIQENDQTTSFVSLKLNT